MQNFIFPYKGVMPKIHPKAFIAPGSSVIGDITIGENSSIWFGCVVRGDVAPITIGKNSNIQDGSIIHVSRDGGKTTVGDNVTIGHRAILHGCHLIDACFIGMGATVMDDVIVETGAMVAAGSLVTNGKCIRAGELWAGTPAKFFRKLTQEEVAFIMVSADNYRIHAQEYLAMLASNSY